MTDFQVRRLLQERRLEAHAATDGELVGFLDKAVQEPLSGAPAPREQERGLPWEGARPAFGSASAFVQAPASS